MIKIGHRGACGYELENTISSFRKALELKVDMVELDVRLCRTNELIVIHDKNVNRISDKTGMVHEKTLLELKLIKTKNEGEISTLEEVISFIDKRCKINIELKEENLENHAVKLIEKFISEEKWSYEDFLISSFNHFQLKNISERNSDIPIAALIEGLPLSFESCFAALNLFSVNMNYEFINKVFIDEAHSHNVNVFVWTVDEYEDINKMKSMGVDGIISNYPDRLF